MAEIPDDQYDRMIRGLRQIANGYRVTPKGHKTRITRNEQQDIARTIFVDMGWHWNREESDAVVS